MVDIARGTATADWPGRTLADPRSVGWSRDVSAEKLIYYRRDLAFGAQKLAR